MMGSPVPAPDAALRRLLALRPSSTDTALGPVEWAESGAGPAILALHGGMGGYDQGFLLVRAVLGPAPGRVISISRPGYLGTPLDHAHTPEQQADLCAALLDHLGVTSALVVAVSAGGPCALHFALRHRARCAGVVLVSACTGHLDIPPGAARRLPFIRFAARAPMLADLLHWLAQRNPHRAAAYSIADGEVLRRTLAHPEAGPLMVALQNSTASRLSERLPGTLNDVAQLASIAPIPAGEVAVPSFVIHGTGDRVVPVSHAWRLIAARPEEQSLLMEKGEHVALFTHLEEIRARLAPFAARCFSEDAGSV